MITNNYNPEGSIRIHVEGRAYAIPYKRDYSRVTTHVACPYADIIALCSLRDVYSLSVRNPPQADYMAGDVLHLEDGVTIHVIYARDLNRNPCGEIGLSYLDAEVSYYSDLLRSMGVSPWYLSGAVGPDSY